MGGFEVAAKAMGWNPVVSCEIDPMCQVVLKHHFPEAYLHGDIHTLTGKIIHEEIERRMGTHWRTTKLVLQWVPVRNMPTLLSSGKATW